MCYLSGNIFPASLNVYLSGNLPVANPYATERIDIVVVLPSG